MKRTIFLFSFLIFLVANITAQDHKAGEAAKGTIPYESFEKPEVCKSCHTDIYQQWDQAMMSKSFVHHWDEIEYFELAVKHGEKDSKFKPVADGCNGCHAPLSYLAGDVPPPRPHLNSRANEGVSCDLCHSITGFEGEVPFNFNYISKPGKIKYGPKEGMVSPHHSTEYSEFVKQTEFCGTCHNEKNPENLWVKSTQLEWKEGPYAKLGVPCQTCHMPQAIDRSAIMSPKKELVAQHLFHGAHDPGKVAGVVEIRMHPEERELELDGTAIIKVQLFNAKTGHKFPTGSVEDRILWLHVTAKDSEGKEYHLPVDKKGFDGEEYTIAADVLAYQDMGIPLDLPNFKGVQRDGVPFGDRIFRMPYFDHNGNMTIMQWNAKEFGVDYRIGPRETKLESYTFEIPADIAVGKVQFFAELNYQKLVKPVADFLKVPVEETEIIKVNSATTWIEVYD